MNSVETPALCFRSRSAAPRGPLPRYPNAQIRQGADRVSAPTRRTVTTAGRGWGTTRDLREARHARESYVPKAACRRRLSAWRLRRESHSRTPYPSAKPTIRMIGGRPQSHSAMSIHHVKPVHLGPASAGLFLVRASSVPAIVLRQHHTQPFSCEDEEPRPNSA